MKKLIITYTKYVQRGIKMIVFSWPFAKENREITTYSLDFVVSI